MPVPDTLTMIRELVAQPSVSSVHASLDQGNRNVISLLANWLSDLGFQVEILPLEEDDAKANLVATLGGGTDGLVLSGHTDTVPFDEARWSQDPFTLREDQQRLYGLGTADMKAFFALVLDAVRDLKAEQLRHPLIILATADEESSMTGARALVNSGRRLGRYAVIGEPTGLRPVRMHKGILMESIHLQGRAGHSSDPALGVNALEGMHQVIAELMNWRRELQQKHTDAEFKVPTPTLNLGYIHGGDNPNRICGECELQIDLRPLPGMELADLRQEMAGRLQRRLENSELILTIKPLFEGIPAMETDGNSPIIQATERLTGHHAESVAFGTEGPFLAEMGMETVILGPGDIDQAHQPDEFLLLERIKPTVALIEKLIQQFCM